MKSVTKIKIINSNKQDFLDFLDNDYNGKILNLLDDEGVELLKKNSYIEDRLSKSHVTKYIKVIDNELDAFLKIII